MQGAPIGLTHVMQGILLCSRSGTHFQCTSQPVVQGSHVPKEAVGTSIESSLPTQQTDVRSCLLLLLLS